MRPRSRNVRIFGASVAGSGLPVGAVMSFMGGGGRWWVYLVGAAACVVLAIAPGRKVRDDLLKLSD